MVIFHSYVSLPEGMLNVFNFKVKFKGPSLLVTTVVGYGSSWEYCEFVILRKKKIVIFSILSTPNLIYLYIYVMYGSIMLDIKSCFQALYILSSFLANVLPTGCSYQFI